MEPFAADVTRERFLASVDSDMLGEPELGEVLLAAVGAQVLEVVFVAA